MKKVGWMLVWLVAGNASAGAGLQVAGVVIDEDHYARPGVKVALMKADQDDWMEIPPGDSPDWDKMIEGRGWWQQTNREGEFRFTGLHSGKYKLTVMGDPPVGGMEYAMVDFELAGESISNVCLVPGVIPRHVLRGVLRSARTGGPVPADVEVTPQELDVTPGSVSWMLEVIQRVRTGPEGGFVKPGLPAGSYSIRLGGLDEEVYGRAEIGFNIRVDDAGAVTIGPHDRAYLEEAGLDLQNEGAEEPGDERGL